MQFPTPGKVHHHPKISIFVDFGSNYTVLKSQSLRNNVVAPPGLLNVSCVGFIYLFEIFQPASLADIVCWGDFLSHQMRLNMMIQNIDKCGTNIDQLEGYCTYVSAHSLTIAYCIQPLLHLIFQASNTFSTTSFWPVWDFKNKISKDWKIHKSLFLSCI